MNLERDFLARTAAETGFRGEMLEKVAHLLNLLRAIRENDFLRTRLALKGGTALNLFHFKMSRLSVDIDLNYIGAADRETMVAERPELEARLSSLCEREGYVIRHTPDTQFAGGKWQLRYASARGGQGNIEIDINYMFRVPLWPLTAKSSISIGALQAEDLLLMDIHELAGGKLAALLDRSAVRDLYDVVRLLSMTEIDHGRLRTALVVYVGMNPHNLTDAVPEALNVSAAEVADRLTPLLRRGEVGSSPPEVRAYTERLLSQCREGLKPLLPFRPQEREFLTELAEMGEIRPELLTNDRELGNRILQQPMLLWRVQNNRKK